MDDKSGLQVDTSGIKEAIVNFLVPLICLGISVALIIIVIYPGYVNRPKAKQEIEVKTQQKLVLEQKSAKLKRLLVFKDVLDQNSTMVDKVLVSKDNVPQLLDEVFQIGTNAGTKVKRLTYSYNEAPNINAANASSKASSAPIYKEVLISLGTEGSYDQLVLLLQKIENAARIVSVNSLRYSIDEKGILAVNYSISSPYLFVQSSAVTDDPVEIDIASQKFIDFVNRIKGFDYYEFKNPNISPFEEAKQTTPSAH